MKSSMLFIGIGVMGKYMASNLSTSKKFENVFIWNRNKTSLNVKYALANGCKYLDIDDPQIENVDVVCICVSDKYSVDEILFENSNITDKLKKGTLIIDFSSIGQNASISIANKLSEKQITYLDAPVSGGDSGAKNKTLSIMVGSDRIPKMAKIVFESVGSKVFFCGGLGKGQAIKSINQLLCAIHSVAVAEAGYMAAQMGLNFEQVIEVCSSGAADSWALRNLGKEIVLNNYEPGFMVKHMLKDINVIASEYNIAFKKLKGLKLAKVGFEKIINLKEVDGSELGTQAMLLAYKAGLEISDK